MHDAGMSNTMLTQPDPMVQHRPWADDGRRCITCRWVEVKLCRADTLGLGCTNPGCCYGQAKRDGACCLWEREPGADDMEPVTN